MIDEQQLGRVLESIRPQLRRFAYELVHNLDGADDMVQEAMVRAWRHRTKFEAIRPLAAWLYLVVRNMHIDMLKKRQPDLVPWEETKAPLVDPMGEVYSRLAAEELAVHLETCLEPRYLAILRLRADGKSLEEIAQTEGISRNAAKQVMHRARTSAQKQAAAYYG